MGSVLVDSYNLVPNAACVHARDGIIGGGALDDRVVGAVAGETKSRQRRSLDGLLLEACVFPRGCELRDVEPLASAV
jgi:hypothetical protein